MFTFPETNSSSLKMMVSKFGISGNITGPPFSGANLLLVSGGVHPGRLTWNLQITHLERKMIFQTSMPVFHVDLQGCIYFLFRRNWYLQPRWPRYLVASGTLDYTDSYGEARVKSCNSKGPNPHPYATFPKKQGLILRDYFFFFFWGGGGIGVRPL